mmetsp:Transcript_6911/g.20831  ORF Transcript_6911/g.20831 Transcript_6911/m.20831 type:complete len:252 (+) Transcript_6911:1735-2490(+)
MLSWYYVIWCFQQWRVRLGASCAAFTTSSPPRCLRFLIRASLSCCFVGCPTLTLQTGSATRIIAGSTRAGAIRTESFAGFGRRLASSTMSSERGCCNLPRAPAACQYRALKHCKALTATLSSLRLKAAPRVYYLARTLASTGLNFHSTHRRTTSRSTCVLQSRRRVLASVRNNSGRRQQVDRRYSVAEKLRHVMCSATVGLPQPVSACVYARQPASRYSAAAPATSSALIMLRPTMMMSLPRALMTLSGVL